MKHCLYLLPFLLFSCAHHKGAGYEDVRPGAGGLNSVLVKTTDETEGSREAIKQARAYCEELGKKPAIVEEKAKYIGEIPEENYKRLQRASKAAGTLTGGALGKRGDDALKDYSGIPYQVEMKFNCE
ncbi:MAG: hypothetical protein EOP11_02660 [Proteobacteria bacterium]|nr:MAG: hypothetical protein EOP11_02660 [Pseudomonadota bacterium]